MDLFGTLSIGTDSVLRIQTHREDKVMHFPLIDIQNLYKEPDYYILNFMKHDIVLEQGTTLTNIFLAIRPWANVLTYLLRTDIESYAKACYGINNNRKQEFKQLLIAKNTNVSRHFSFSVDEGKTSLQDLLNSYISNETSLFDIEEIISFSGVDENDNIFSTSFIPFVSLKDTPIVLNQTPKINFYLRENDGIFQSEVKGVLKNKKGEAVLEQDFENYSFFELLDSVLNYGLFEYRPLSVEEADLQTDELIEAKDAALKKYSKPSLALVGSNQQTEEKGQDNVILADSFFNDLDDEKDHEEQIWDHIYQSLISNSNVKIGEIQ